MAFPDLSALSLPLLWLSFASASALVWFAGTRLSRLTEALARKTGTADEVMGSLLLGGITSLPEVVTTITASASDNAGIAINNLFGGVALQVTLLAVADVLVKKRSVTSLVSSPVVQLQGILGIILIATAAGVVVTGDRGFVNIGFGSFLILVLFVSGFVLVSYLKTIQWWKSDPDARDSINQVRESIARGETDEPEPRSEEDTSPSSPSRGMSKRRLSLWLALSALAVLVGGYTVVQSGEVLSEKTGLGSGVMGAIFIALSTSLPELSTTIASVRRQNYRLAFSNIFGTNIFTIAFVFLADVFYRKGPVLNHVDNFSLFAAMLGLALTAVYLVGLTVRLKKTILNLGYDSVVVLVGYLTGLVIMFSVLKS